MEIVKSYSHKFSIKISVKSTFCEEAEIKFMMHFLVMVNLIFFHTVKAHFSKVVSSFDERPTFTTWVCYDVVDLDVD